MGPLFSTPFAGCALPHGMRALKVKGTCPPRAHATLLDLLLPGTPEFPVPMVLSFLQPSRGVLSCQQYVPGPEGGQRAAISKEDECVDWGTHSAVHKAL